MCIGLSASFAQLKFSGADRPALVGVTKIYLLAAQQMSERDDGFLVIGAIDIDQHPANAALSRGQVNAELVGAAVDLRLVGVAATRGQLRHALAATAQCI